MNKNNPIQLFKVFMSKEAIYKTTKTLSSGFIGQGSVVEEFENSLKEYFNSNYVVTTNSATSAEHIVFHMLKNKKKGCEFVDKTDHIDFDWPGINPEDHVLTTALTCTASNWPILLNGINLRWVDVDPNTCNIDLNDLESKINQFTKAILVVHWGGYPVDLNKLLMIQKKSLEKYGFAPAIIEDCAHAFGSKYNNKLVGSHGNICTFSFQAIKHLTSGDGGCVVFNNENDVRRAKLLRWFGINRDENRKDFRCEEDIQEIGYKMHMNDINASIGLENLPYAKDFVVNSHKKNAHFYNESLKSIPGVTLLENSLNCESSYWLYTIKVENQEGFMKKMKESNIMVSRVHERNDIHSCVKKYKSPLPNLDKLVKEMICIPVGWWVSSQEREYILEEIKKGW